MDRAASRLLRRRLPPAPFGVRSASSASVRRTFIDFFEREHGHLMIPSSPVLAYRDPTLPFINSGMNQFKRVFLGEVAPASNRVVNSQKCLRLKGKHNDLDRVGLDGTHHTFFEMLGNWSFGDYFKKEACSMAWNLLTKVYGIPEERLYVTYFSGDESLSLPPDVETPEIWAEIGVPRHRILPFGLKDNFWEMASKGPCGPCTEIHYDHVAGRTDAGQLVNSGSPEVTEIWNLVFMEFNRTSETTLEKLHQHFVDTGMGLERLVAVTEGKTSNYETDLFLPLFDVIRRVSGHPGYGGTYGGSDVDVAYRVLADHARMLTVALSDGMLPNMHNRVRAIARRAFTISRKTFGVDKGLVKELTNHVAESLAPFHPEIGRRMDKVHYILDEEEESLRKRQAEAQEEWLGIVTKHPKFLEINVDMTPELVNGYTYLRKNVLNRNMSVIESETAWILFDTYGVPVSVISDMANALGLTFDLEAYETYRSGLLQTKRAQNETKFNAHRETIKELSAQFQELGLQETRDDLRYDYKRTADGRYEFPDVRAKILAFVRYGKVVDRINAADIGEGEAIGVVLDKTNLFAASEDQRSDSGTFEVDGGGARFKVYSAERVGRQIVHYGGFEELSTGLSTNQEGVLRVNETSRVGIMRSTTAVHLLKAVLSRRLRTFAEVSAKAEYDVFRLSFTTYDDSLETKDILELENELSALIRSESSTRWEWHDAQDVWRMADLITKPGQTFIEARAPVLEITAPGLSARLACSGIPAQLPELFDLIITDYRKVGYRVKEIAGAVREKAVVGKSRNEAFLSEWGHVRDFHVAQFEDKESILKRIDMITAFVKEYSSFQLMSYYIKASLKEETSQKLEKLNKYIRREIRAERHATRRLWK